MENNVKSSTIVNVEERELVLERTFDAHRRDVFKAYTHPERVAAWYGPKDWVTTNYKMDVRPDGLWHYCMRGPKGEEQWGLAVFHTVEEPDRLVYTGMVSDADGNVVEGNIRYVVAVEFVNFEGRTRLVMRIQFDSTAALESMLGKGIVQYGIEAWDRLDALLRTDQALKQ